MKVTQDVKNAEFHRRIKTLEKDTHSFDFDHLIARLDAAERRIADLMDDVEYLRNASRPNGLR